MRTGGFDSANAPTGTSWSPESLPGTSLTPVQSISVLKEPAWHSLRRAAAPAKAAELPLQQCAPVPPPPPQASVSEVQNLLCSSCTGRRSRGASHPQRLIWRSLKSHINFPLITALQRLCTKEQDKSRSRHTNAQGMQGERQRVTKHICILSPLIERLYIMNHNYGLATASFLLQQPAKAPNPAWEENSLPSIPKKEGRVYRAAWMN